MRKALYRKYRPTKLSEVIGEDHITNSLAKAISQQKISHAYLFTGPRGTGKTSVARIFAHEINQFKYEIEDSYLDIIEIDAASNTGVENIRELREKAIIAPTKGKYKIYIIDEVHMLSKSAFNALLKTLEEPPEHVIFIMATTDAHKVPVTITSRSQNFNFHLADHDTMFKHLSEIAKKESINIEQDALKIIVKRGGGSFRDSLSLLDQISTLDNDKITLEIVNSVLGLPHDDIIADFCSSYKKSDITNISESFKQLLSSGVKPEILNEELIKYIINYPEIELLPLLSKLSEIKPPFIEAKLLLALLPNNTPVPQTQTTFQAIRKNTYTQTNPPKSQIENKNISYSNQNDFNWDAFIERVKEQDSGIATMLKNFNYEIANGNLHLFPPNLTNQKLFSAEKRKQVLNNASSLNIIIEDFKTKRKSLKKDPTLQQINAIMGEVQEVKENGDPFQS